MGDLVNGETCLVLRYEDSILKIHHLSVDWPIDSIKSQKDSWNWIKLFKRSPRRISTWQEHSERKAMRTNSPYWIEKHIVKFLHREKTPTDQLIKAQSPPVYPSIYANLVYDKVDISNQCWKAALFHKWWWLFQNGYLENNRVRSLPHSLH